MATPSCFCCESSCMPDCCCHRPPRQFAYAKGCYMLATTFPFINRRTWPTKKKSPKIGGRSKVKHKTCPEIETTLVSISCVSIFKTLRGFTYLLKLRKTLRQMRFVPSGVLTLCTTFNRGALRRCLPRRQREVDLDVTQCR